MTSKLSRLALLSSIAVLASACTIRWGEGDLDEDRFDDDDTLFEDDVEDDDGSSADVGSGAGGAGGGDAVTVGSGAGGSAPSCTPPEGYGPSVSECDVLPTSPQWSDASCDGYDPLPYMACERAFEIYNPGQAEQLAICLGDIGEADACNSAPVADCVTEMYTDACESSYVVEACEGFAVACSDSGDTIDEAMCVADLNPFSESGVGQLVDCMNATDGTCQERYDLCLEEVIQL